MTHAKTLRTRDDAGLSPDMADTAPASAGDKQLYRSSFASASEPELSLSLIIQVLLANIRMIAALVGGAVILAVVIVLLTPRTYTSTTSFLPENRRSGGGLSSLAQQYGISLPGMASDPGQSLPFYVELARSREILSRLLVDTIRYDVERRTVARPVVDALEVKGNDLAERVENGVRQLRLMIKPISNPNTGIVRIDVTARSPQLSQALAQRALELINDFNLRKRQSQGASERRFAEQRLAEVTDSLHAAEQRLLEFEQRNAQYTSSPALRTQHERLADNVSAKQTLHTMLAQSYEQARIEEVRDTPVITTLERPAVPVHADSRRGLQKLMLAAALALVLGVGLAFARSGLWTLR